MDKCIRNGEMDISGEIILGGTLQQSELNFPIRTNEWNCMDNMGLSPCRYHICYFKKIQSYTNNLANLVYGFHHAMGGALEY
jgi:hypothetical protein